MQFHEDLNRGPGRRGPSDRRFGFEIAAVLALIAVWRFHWDLRLLAAAASVFAAALIWPRWLRPLNRVWTRIGHLLACFLNPVASAILFYLVFTPAGVIMRLLGRNELQLRRDPHAQTYWIPRQRPVSSIDWFVQF
jgi:hypothetical protein